MESVEYKLQCMVPDLTALLERGLFTKEELRKVLEKRSQFEYSIRSSNRSPEDFYKYLQFEQKLEELRKLRATRLSLEGGRNDLSEFCIVKHIHLIYSQATIVFKSNIELWKQWFAFCRDSNSTQRMSKALAEALRFNPHVVEFWVLAAQWQLEDCQNGTLARSIMQQGIRNCQNSKDLWIEYFKLELTIVQKLMTRRELLELKESSNESLKEVLNGFLAFRVFQESMSKFPKDLNHIKGILQSLSQFSFPEDFELESLILEATKKAFPLDVEVWDMDCRLIFEKTWKSQDVMEGVKIALERYFEGFDKLKDVDLYSPCLLFLKDVYDHLEEQESPIQVALFHQMKRVLELAFEASLISPNAILAFVEIAKKHNSKELKEILMESIRFHPESLALFKELINHLKVPDSESQSSSLIDECIVILSTYSGSSLAQLWIQMIDLFLHLGLPLTKLLEHYIKMIPNCTNAPQKQQVGEISKHIFESLETHGSLVEAESFAKKLLQEPFLDVGSYSSIIDVFQSRIHSRKDIKAIQQVAQLFEKTVRLFGDRVESVWTEFIKFEHRWGQQNIGAIYRRAKNSGLEDLRSIHECLRNLH